MFPFPADSPYPFDKPLHNHHEASLPFPPPKLDASSPLFPLSPPFFDHELLNDLSLLAPPPQISPPSPPPLAPFRTEGPSTHKNAVAALPTKPSCASTATAAARKVLGSGGRRLRKDRHSKICTAQGPRDRRMRLSLDVARKFFDLQDLLGFDKASKTVDWLLTSCKASIMELTGSCSPLAHLNASAGGDNAKSESSTSECEVLSTSTNTTPAAAAARRAAVRRPRKGTAQHPAPSRESRVMARARARERTTEKRMRRTGFEDGDQKRQAVSSSIQLEAAGEESGTHTTRSSLDMGQPSSCSPDQCKKNAGASPPAVITGGYDPISIFDYGQNIVHNGDGAIGFVQEHWGVQPLGNFEEQRLLLADAQLQHWLWEAFNPSI